jgi:hypothetical protein
MTDDSTGGPADGASGSDDPEPVPDAATGNHWKQLVLEMEEMADRHRNAGWGTTVLYPTASGVVDDPEPGIGVVVPREAFDALDTAVSTRAVDEYEVLRADLPGEIQILTVLYTDDAGMAIFAPAAVDADRLADLRPRVEGTLYTHVTPPEEDATISFTHDDPTLFFPGGDGGNEDEADVESS